MKNKKEKNVRPASETSKVEGEGSYTATRRYDAGVEKTVKSGKVAELGREAARALDGPEGQELRDAEKAGRAGKSITTTTNERKTS